jgi:pyruvate, orthophosphate dikinase
MSWVDPVRRLKIRANADIPRDAKQARLFGAEGIGLCRTEHMFFAEDRIEHMRAMILADNEKDRRDALKKLLPMQRADFVGLFKAMDRCRSPSACSILRCTSSCPSAKICWSRSQHLEDTKPARPSSRNCAAAGACPGAARDEPHARPARLPPRHRVPEITEMQARAIFEAAVTSSQGRRSAPRNHGPAHRLH